MARRKSATKSSASTGANIGFEAQLWQMAGAFEECHAQLVNEEAQSAALQEDDGEPFEEKMARWVAELREQRAEAAKLDAAIERNLACLGFDIGKEERPKNKD